MSWLSSVDNRTAVHSQQYLVSYDLSSGPPVFATKFLSSRSCTACSPAEILAVTESSNSICRQSSVSVPKKNIPKKNTSRNLVYSYFANFANLHFYWQLNSVIAITFSCIDSIDCSPFSRNEPGENVVKLHLHNWNIQFEICVRTDIGLSYVRTY